MPREQVVGALLATDAPRLNLLTNGGFEIWQRGNGPFTATSAFAADRWSLALAAGDTLSVSRDSANADVGSVYCAACTYVRSTGSSWLNQLLSVNNDGPMALRGRTMTLSIRVKTSTPNAVRAVYADGLGNFFYGPYHTGDNTYQTLSYTFTWPASGSTAFRVGVDFEASCTAYVDNAMLVVGAVAADYAPLHPADDFARCERYYEVIGGQVTNSPQLFSYGATSQQVSIPISFHARKAVIPSVTKNGTWSANNCTQPGAAADLDLWTFYVNVTAIGSFNVMSNAAGQTFVFEANP